MKIKINDKGSAMHGWTSGELTVELARELIEILDDSLVNWEYTC